MCFSCNDCIVTIVPKQTVCFTELCRLYFCLLRHIKTVLSREIHNRHGRSGNFVAKRGYSCKHSSLNTYGSVPSIALEQITSGRARRIFVLNPIFRVGFLRCTDVLQQALVTVIEEPHRRAFHGWLAGRGLTAFVSPRRRYIWMAQWRHCFYRRSKLTLGQPPRQMIGIEDTKPGKRALKMWYYGECGAVVGVS